MKKIVILLVSVLGLGACKSTPTSTDSAQFDNLPLQDAILQTDTWNQLQRMAALYPVEAAVAGSEGCATIEYVIMPDYQIYIVQTVDATGREYAREAKKVIQRWNWQQLPVGLLTEPAKTRTRFEFCLENETGQCSSERLAALTQCSGSDVLPSIGYRI